MELFQCPQYGGTLRLTPGACAQQYRRAKKVDQWDQLAPCKGCAIGASHAGEKVEHAPPAHVCLRCDKPAGRLIRGQICVSCYNREREALTGRYRRSKPPANLRVTKLAVAIAGAYTPVSVLAASASEAMLMAVRRHPGQPVLAAAPGGRLPWAAQCQSIQLSLLPGA